MILTVIFFFDIFVPLLEKKSTFNEKLMTATKDKELFCISSEAFGLLVLENHWNRWLDIYIKCEDKIKDRKKMEKLTNIQPKYTREGLKNSCNRDIGIKKEWSFQSIDHFNQLFAFVRDDREDYPNFTRDWIATKKEAMISNSRKRNTKIPQKDLHNGHYLQIKIWAQEML